MKRQYNCMCLGLVGELLYVLWFLSRIIIMRRDTDNRARDTGNSARDTKNVIRDTNNSVRDTDNSLKG